MIIKPILQKLGIVQSAADKKATEAITNIPAYSPEYYKSHPGMVTKTKAFMEQSAQIVHSAFNIFVDNYSDIIGVFKQFKTKSDVSYFAEIFFNKYNTDLYGFLQDGGGLFPWDGLSTAHLNQINDYVNSLP